VFGAEPDRVAATVTRDPQSGVDILTSGVLEFGNRTANFTCSTRCEPHQRVDIHGTQGRVTIDIPFNIPPDRATQIHFTSGGNPPVAPATETFTFEPADQYRIEAELFAAAILGETEVPVPPQDGVSNMVVLEQLLEAAHEH
jgi:predicted dehydrogenase